jgi:hypothetical protein
MSAYEAQPRTILQAQFTGENCEISCRGTWIIPQIQVSPSWRCILSPLNRRRRNRGATSQFNQAPKHGDQLVKFRSVFLATMILSASTAAYAQSSGSEMGTPEQRDACGPDVRKFCYKIKESDGQDAYLQCLELNRSKLSARCVGMLQSYGK